MEKEAWKTKWRIHNNYSNDWSRLIAIASSQVKGGIYRQIVYNIINDPRKRKIAGKKATQLAKRGKVPVNANAAAGIELCSPLVAFLPILSTMYVLYSTCMLLVPTGER